jgi:signal transduction histidine kinase
MIHELRNPMNALLGSVELLEQSENAYAYDEEVLTTAKICGDTLMNLIGNILDASKIEANKLELLPEPVYIKETLEKVHRIALITSKPKALFVKLLIDPNLPECLSLDPKKLTQVLINLIGNAVKFTDKGGIIMKVEWIPLPDKTQLRSVLKRALSTSHRAHYVETSQELLTEDTDEIGPKAFQKYQNFFSSHPSSIG